jgi:hypothetical protein
MAQPVAAAGDANNVVDAPAIDPIDAIVDQFLPDDDDKQDAADDPNAPPAQDDDLTADDLDDKADDLPPIDAPVSWTTEEKAKFAELPREVQETLSRRETEREKFVQSKANETARAKHEAERVALQQVAEIERQAVEQLQRLSASLLPQRPDPRLLQGTDEHRALFYHQQAQFEQAVAQQQQLQQAVQERDQKLNQYQTELQRREASENVQILQDQFPEYLDPAKTELRQSLASTAAALGYSSEQIAQARAPDILAMKVAAEWKAKADQLDALNKVKMEKVRQAKTLPPVAKPGTAQPRGQASKRHGAVVREVQGDQGLRRCRRFPRQGRLALGPVKTQPGLAS